MKRRVLHDLRIDKIAAVDSPCQEHATMAIIKRARIPERTIFEARGGPEEIAKALTEALGIVRKEIDKPVVLSVGDPVEAAKAFEHVQKDIDRNTAALAEMGFGEAEQRKAKNMADDFPATVAAIQKRDGCSRLIALQKAATEHPDALEAYRSVEHSDEAGPVLKVAVAKRAFDACIQEMMKRGGVSRLKAMELAREEYPNEFQALSVA